MRNRFFKCFSNLLTDVSFWNTLTEYNKDKFNLLDKFFSNELHTKIK